MVVENVKGAQKWVGKASWHYGSYYLWGDVPALMPIVPRAIKNDGGSWFNIAHNTTSGVANNPDGRKTAGHINKRDGYTHTRHLTNQRESDGVKFSQSGHAWFDGKPRDKMSVDKGPAAYASRSNSRKMASAMIAKIPLPLSIHIARTFKPEEKEDPPKRAIFTELMEA